MPDTVRYVSDGEELVLSEGEAFRVRRESSAHATAPRPAGPAVRRPIAIQYVGFEDVRGRREYRFDARNAEHMRRYVVWIEQAAFSSRQALLQDGPDICYQKLSRHVAASEMQGDDHIAVTEGDLAAYREAHTAPSRRGFSAPPRTPPSAEQGAAPGKAGGTA